MAKIEAVTAEEVQELAQELFRPDRLSLALIGPYSDPEPFTKLLESL
jgi:predicted Zn-dependent peptidase